MSTTFCILALSSLIAAVTAFGEIRTRIFSNTALKANILDTISDSGNFKTLIAAITTTGLNTDLSGAGPFTLFAPTDEAFAKLGPADELLKDVAALKNILLYHVHPGKFNPTRNGRTLDSLLMGPSSNPNIQFPKQLTIKVTSWELRKYVLSGQPNHAEIITSDIKCDNGLVHIIDEVLIPPETTDSPKVTFIGGRDLEKTESLQLSYYGSEEGKGRHGEVYEGEDKPFEPIPLGDAWKYGGNWKGGIEHDGNNPNW